MGGLGLLENYLPQKLALSTSFWRVMLWTAMLGCLLDGYARLAPGWLGWAVSWMARLGCLLDS